MLWICLVDNLLKAVDNLTFMWIKRKTFSIKKEISRIIDLKVLASNLFSIFIPGFPQLTTLCLF